MIHARNRLNAKTIRCPNGGKGSKGGLSKQGQKSFVTREAEMPVSYRVCAKRSHDKSAIRQIRRKHVHKGKRRLRRQRSQHPLHTSAVCSPLRVSRQRRLGLFEGQSGLMIFDRHATLKYNYENPHFWGRGHGRTQQNSRCKRYQKSVRAKILWQTGCLSRNTKPVCGQSEYNGIKTCRFGGGL